MPNLILKNFSNPATVFYKLRLATRKLKKNLNQTEVAVGLSGGADSLALTAALVAEGFIVTALIIDHGLQPNSTKVAETALTQAKLIGCTEAKIIPVQVIETHLGLEAAARNARYTALKTARANKPVMLAHTMDDQAETVLLGLGRGAGAQSIQGMRAINPPWYRPFLEIRKAETIMACQELNLTPCQDPHNKDKRFQRVRIRHEVLPLLEDVLAGGVVSALAKTALFLQQDNQYLQQIATEFYNNQAQHKFLLVQELEKLAAAIRIRVFKIWLQKNGVGFVSAIQLNNIDKLVTTWKGQGAVAITGKIELDENIFINDPVRKVDNRLKVYRKADKILLNSIGEA